MHPRSRTLIHELSLQPHPERGHYAETYRAPVSVQAATHLGARAASTAIYFLIDAEQGSTFLHRLLSDEIFHLYEGGPLEVLCLRDGEPPAVQRLGLDLSRGERPQLIIPAGTWFGAELPAGVDYCLFGCTVAPGFEFADFELAQGQELLMRFGENSPGSNPSISARIARMLRS